MVIKSTSYSNNEIINNILELHNDGNSIDCDCCYSKGVFYKDGTVEQPRLKFDISPQTEDTVQADCRNLPLENNSIHCMMFDPPFVIGVGKSLFSDDDSQCKTQKRFSGFSNVEELISFYYDSLVELYRVIENNGVLIFKCQDTVSCGTNFFSHIYISEIAQSLGFYLKDLFVLNSKARIISGKVVNQQHARKFHSYFLVFTKNEKKLNVVKSKIYDFLIDRFFDDV